MARLLVLLGIVTIAASAQTIQVSPVSQQTVEKRLGACITENNKHEPAGCAGNKLTEQPVKSLNAPNLICTLAGATRFVIVVGAHFDLVENGFGVVDN